MELTTLLLLADIAESARGTAGLIIFVGGLAFIIASIAFIIQRGEVANRLRTEERYKELSTSGTHYLENLVCASAEAQEWISYKNGSKYILMVAGPLLVLALIVQILMPTRKTIYIIAGLKAADGIVNSEIGKKTQELLFRKIDSYLNEQTDEKKDKKEGKYHIEFGI